MVNISLVVACLVSITACTAIPLPENQQELQNYFRQGAAVGGGGIIGAIGNALVPVFGAILSNLASGIATTFNNGIAAGANGNPTNNNNNNNNANRPNNRPRPSFDAYMVHVPGIEEPYVLLTNQELNNIPHADNNIVNPVAEVSKIQLQALAAQNFFNQENTNLEPTDTRLNDKLGHLEQAEITE